MAAKINDQQIRSRIVALISHSKQPVGIQYVAKEFGISWNTARALLLVLLIDGKITGTKTANGTWFFYKEVAIPAQ